MDELDQQLESCRLNVINNLRVIDTSMTFSVFPRGVNSIAINDAALNIVKETQRIFLLLEMKRKA